MYDKSMVQISKKIMIFFLIGQIILVVCCSKEYTHQDGSFEYPQHMFQLRNKKINFQRHTLCLEAWIGQISILTPTLLK